MKTQKVDTPFGVAKVSPHSGFLIGKESQGLIQIKIPDATVDGKKYRISVYYGLDLVPVTSSADPENDPSAYRIETYEGNHTWRFMDTQLRERVVMPVLAQTVAEYTYTDHYAQVVRESLLMSINDSLEHLDHAASVLLEKIETTNSVYGMESFLEVQEALEALRLSAKQHIG